MLIRIADTFTDSLARLTATEQKAVKTTAFDLQLHPEAFGHRFHRIDGARDPGFWSVRVNDDIRLIVHRSGESLLLAYVDHHDAAYRWAVRRRIERHPTTGAMQLVELPEVAGRAVPVEEGRSTRKAEAPLAELTAEQLLRFGVPPDWIEPLRAADEDALLEMLGRLPAEAAEALLRLATGERAEPAPVLPPELDGFRHPDSERRFRLVGTIEELRRALEAPWERWAIFLHPDQRRLVERRFAGAARVAGSAGTGKTVVAIHRAVHLARTAPSRRVLLTTFSPALASALAAKVALLMAGEAELGRRIVTRALPDLGVELYTATFGVPRLASPEEQRALVEEAAAAGPAGRLSIGFLWSEWRDHVDPWQIADFASYERTPRLGRRTRLGSQQRRAVWAVMAAVREALARRGLLTRAQLFGALTARLRQGLDLPFDCAVVDEAQDLGVAEARFLAAAFAGRPDGLFLAGDLGQRIFQVPFSWKQVGIDVRGRSAVLRVNYRTSHQIRVHADRLLPAEVSDVDGNTESRRGTVSVFEGPPPEIRVARSLEEERAWVAAWLRDRLREGYAPEQIALFVRSQAELDRARRAAAAAGVASHLLDESAVAKPGSVALGTMHLAKGLEYRAVAVLACDDEVLPSQARIEGAADEGELEEIYHTERHLLYVACTRARDRLLITGVDPASEFLDDLRDRGPSGGVPRPLL